MSDEAVVVPSTVSGGLTAGMLLRQAREATGLHIAALAVSMKVPVKKLEALEADRLEELPDAVFIRALASSMCRTLKVDPAPVLSKLPQSAVPKLDKSDRGISMPTHGSQFLTGNSLMSVATKPAALAVVALLLAALAVVLFPEARNTVGTAEPGKPVPDEAVAAALAKDVAPVAVPAVAPVVAEKPPAAAPGPELPVQAAAAVTEQVQVAALAPVPAANKAVLAASEAGAATSGLLVFKASATSWVRVSDSKGSVKFEKTLAAGETAVATGVPPLSVVVGNVAATEVLLRGQPFTMQDLNQNNVARFEVK